MFIAISTNSFNEAYKNIGKTLIEDPEHTITNRKGTTVYELLNPSFIIREPHKCFATCRYMSIPYLEGEMEFYISGSPFLKDIAKYSKFWEKCSDDGRSVNSNYGKLLLHDRNQINYTQFEYARDMLLRNKESKKAVMTIYSKENAYKSNDNPCTMYLQFFIRDDRLNLFVKMRSSDIWFGLPYDVPFFVYILYRMFFELKASLSLAEKHPFEDLKVGHYNHQSGSLHLYKKDVESIKKCFANYTKDFSQGKEDKEQGTMFEELIMKRLLEDGYGY